MAYEIRIHNENNELVYSDNDFTGNGAFDHIFDIRFELNEGETATLVNLDTDEVVETHTWNEEG